MATGKDLSIITLNVNGLNAPTKRQSLDEWIQKQDSYIWYLQETHLKTGTHTDWNWKAGKGIHEKGDQEKSGVAILISEKIDFEIKAVTRDKEGSIQEGPKNQSKDQSKKKI